MTKQYENYTPKWDGDVLNRCESAKFLTYYLNNLHGDNTEDPIYESSYVLCLNADWGFGKTYLLKNWAVDLEETLQHPVVYFDAWKNDFSDDPLLAFVSELEVSLKVYIDRIPKGKKLVSNIVDTGKAAIAPLLKTAANILIKKATGSNGEELYQMVSAASEGAIDSYINDALESHNRRKEKIRKFSEELESLLKELQSKGLNLPMYIFIDELDRCKPSYAIQLLEGVKHIFGTKGVFFVIATNKNQLSKSIKAIYGTEFDSIAYLQRFFDQEYQLPPPDFNQFSKLLIEKRYRLNQLQFVMLGENDDLTVTFALLAQGFSLSLRAQDHSAKQLKALALTNALPQKVHHWFLLFLIMFRIKNEVAYEEFIKKDPGDFRIAKDYFDTSIWMIGYGRVTENGFPQQRKELISVSDILKEYLRLEHKSLVELNNEEITSVGTIPKIKHTFLNTESAAPYDSNRHYPLSISKYKSMIIQAGQLI